MGSPYFYSIVINPQPGKNIKYYISSINSKEDWQLNQSMTYKMEKDSNGQFG